MINAKETSSIDLKFFKERLDTIMKICNSQIDSSEKGLKLYAKSLNETTERNYKLEVENLSNRISDTRMDNHRHAVDLQKTSIELKNEAENIMNLKKDVLTQFDKGVLNIKDQINVTNNEFEKLKSEYEIMKKKFNETAEFIKVTH